MTDWEEEARSFPTAKRSLLPVKRNGKWEKVETEVEDPSDHSDHSESLSSTAKVDWSRPPKKLPSSALRQIQAEEEQKEKIASLCNSLIADPEGEIKKLGQLRHTFQTFLQEASKDGDWEMASLTAKSLCLVFADILPAYSIRQLTEVEKKEKVSKEVARSREFESSLLSCPKIIR
jgi:nucleolar complex protein 3